MTRRRDRSGSIGFVIVGFILLVVGGYYVLTNTLGLDLGPINWDVIWPIIVLGLGVIFLASAFGLRGTDQPPAGSPPTTPPPVGPPTATPPPTTQPPATQPRA